MASIFGDDEDSVLFGTAEYDLIYGGRNNDTIYGYAGHDALFGGNGAGSDTLYGGDGNDSLHGGGFAASAYDYDGFDTIYGGLGDDRMAGDRFVFNFGVPEQRDQVLTTVQFRDGDTPAESASAVAWSNYLNQLQSWRDALTLVHGADLSNSMDESVMLTASPRKAAKDVVTGLKTYDKDFSYMADGSTVSMVATGEGHDTIYYWARQRGYEEQVGWGPWSSDHKTLKLSGLSGVATDANFYGNFVSVDTERDLLTVLTIGDSSITLVGVDTTMAQLVAGGHITF
jgi:Ca2+-binding RTX toxin-like protein